jgi:RNA polymerase sigma-70 factor (ECF subfamily)
MVEANIHAKRTGNRCPNHADTFELASDIQTVMAAMPPQMQELCRRMVTESLSAIARDIGVARSTLQEEVQKIRRRFESAGLRAFL